MLSTYARFLLSFDPYLYHIDSMASRLFLNLRSAAYDTPGNVHTQSTAVVLGGNRQDRLREGISGQSPRPTHLDTTGMHIYTPRRVEWDTFGEPKQVFGQDTLGKEDVGHLDEGDIELQLRGGRLASMPHWTL
jgi:hypothetical protein